MHFVLFSQFSHVFQTYMNKKFYLFKILSHYKVERNFLEYEIIYIIKDKNQINQILR